MLGENNASTIPALQLVPPVGSSVLHWKCQQLGLHAGCSADPFGCPRAGLGQAAVQGQPQLSAQTVTMLFTLISLALFTKEKAKFIHTEECDQQQTLKMTKLSLVSTNIMDFPTNTPKHGIFWLQNTSGGWKPPHDPVTKWFSAHC